jgi:HEAT repeat protein
VLADRRVILPILLDLLDAPDGDTRWSAIHSLLRLGATDTQIGESIQRAMTHGAYDLSGHGPSSWDVGRCWEALEIIGALGPLAAPFIPLLEQLRDSDYEVRPPQATYALAKVRGNMEAVVPELIAALAETDPPCPCQSAAQFLGEIGPAAVAAVPALKRMARHGANIHNRRAALKALKHIDPNVADELEKTFSWSARY